MLYTVVPLERIYSNMAKSVLDEYKVKGLMPKDEPVTYKDIPIAHGKILAQLEGDKYVVSRINSTDMADYLNSKYAPGSQIKIDDFWI
ncbi:MAG: hypothetical protein GX323_06315 [Clostridiales bacterium]|nr:hypothetical protein [Clostridiales bacterium]